MSKKYGLMTIGKFEKLCMYIGAAEIVLFTTRLAGRIAEHFSDCKDESDDQ